MWEQYCCFSVWTLRSFVCSFSCVAIRVLLLRYWLFCVVVFAFVSSQLFSWSEYCEYVYVVFFLRVFLLCVVSSLVRSSSASSSYWANQLSLMRWLRLWRSGGLHRSVSCLKTSYEQQGLTNKQPTNNQHCSRRQRVEMQLCKCKRCHRRGHKPPVNNDTNLLFVDFECRLECIALHTGHPRAVETWGAQAFPSPLVNVLRGAWDTIPMRVPEDVQEDSPPRDWAVFSAPAKGHHREFVFMLLLLP